MTLADRRGPLGPAGPAAVPDAMAQDGGPPTARRRWAAGIALVALCLVVLDTAVAVLGRDALRPGVPLLDVLTVQRVVVGAGLVAALVAAPGRSTLSSALDLPLVSLLAVAGLATLTNLPNGASTAPWRSLLTAVAVHYLTVAALRTHAHALPALLVSVLGAAFVAGALGVEQYLEARADDTAAAVVGPFGQPAQLAGYLALALPLLVPLLAPHLFRQGEDGLRRMAPAWWVLSAVAALALLLSQARGPLAGLFLAAVAMALAVPGRHRQGGRPLLLAAGGLLAGVALLVLVAGASGVLGSVTGRSGAWSAALQTAGGAGLNGVGFGGSEAAIAAATGRASGDAQNMWLAWMVDVGPVGPVLVTVTMVTALVVGARRAGAGSLPAAAASAAVLAFTTASLVDHPAAAQSVLVLLMVVLGVAVAEPGPCPPAGRHVAQADDTRAG